MRLKSLLFRYFGGLILALVSTQSWAGPIDLVEIRGLVGFSCSSGSGGFEQDCVNDNIEIGPFSLIYDPSVPDTDSSQDRGLFQDAIRSFSMTVSQKYRPDLVFSLVGYGDFHRLRTAQLEGWLYWDMILSEKNNVLPPSRFSFGWWEPVMPGDPNEMPTTDFWFTRTPFGGGTTGVGETDWLYGGLSVHTVPRPLPAPPSLWLLLIGVAGAFLQRGRLRKS